MNRFVHTLLNLATGFVIAFAVGSLVRNRRAGLRAGLVTGVAFGVIAWAFHDRGEEFGDVDDQRRVGETEP